MNPNREEALFELALEKPAAERAAFLDGACHDDPSLRRRLETPTRRTSTAGKSDSVLPDLAVP